MLAMLARRKFHVCLYEKHIIKIYSAKIKTMKVFSYFIIDSGEQIEFITQLKNLSLL